MSEQDHPDDTLGVPGAVWEAAVRGPVTTHELAQRAGVCRQTAHRALVAGWESGYLVRRQRQDGRGAPDEYAIRRPTDAE